MARIIQSTFGETPFLKLLGHNKNVATAWTQLGEVLETDGRLSAILKEQVRRQLAQGNGCEYCKAKGKPDPRLYDEKISVAVGFAEVCLNNTKGTVPDSAFNVLKKFFSEEEISELCAFICFTIAQQYFGALMKLEANG